ncbi:hypothetical protein [Kitasatospora fiedleri]|uniref:hypothetical protein n=1 Tax=Kitasatospora fiedleri TaxID=2991545 RepID=UPI002499B6B0|nr:hypothetical protein [Kitasatospora fiedleri]
MVKEYRDRTESGIDGMAGLLVEVDTEDTMCPYLVQPDGCGTVWVHSIRPEPTASDPELAGHPRTSAAQDAADFARRSAAAEKARELLRGSSGDPFVAGAPSEEHIIRLAVWLLGEND